MRKKIKEARERKLKEAFAGKRRALKEKYEEGGSVSGKNEKGQLAALAMGFEGRSKYKRAND